MITDLKMEEMNGQELMKIGAKVVRHARYITFQLAEIAVPRKLFEATLQKIDRLRLCRTQDNPSDQRKSGVNI